MEILEKLLNVALLVATLRTTAPILLVDLGGSFTTKAGIFNIGLEGQMLVGAFFAVLGSIWSGSAFVGVLCGVAAALVFAFIFAILLIYLVLAAQFESLVDPFIILLTVPMAVTGALLSLWITHQSINIFSEIGIIMLIGLITKNGILIVEFANQRKAEGMKPREAVLAAAASRFRPILMTTLAMIFGTLPIALSLGTSSGSRTSLGIVVVGGLIFAGILTLYVIPAVYSYFSRPYRAKKESENKPAVITVPGSIVPA